MSRDNVIIPLEGFSACPCADPVQERQPLPLSLAAQLLFGPSKAQAPLLGPLVDGAFPTRRFRGERLPHGAAAVERFPLIDHQKPLELAHPGAAVKHVRGILGPWEEPARR